MSKQPSEMYPARPEYSFVGEDNIITKQSTTAYVTSQRPHEKVNNLSLLKSTSFTFVQAFLNDREENLLRARSFGNIPE